MDKSPERKKRRMPPDGDLHLAQRKCIWTCEGCSYTKNKDLASHCEICHLAAPRTRFAVRINGKHFLCAIKKGGGQEPDSLTFVDAAGFKVSLGIDSTVEDLGGRIAATIETFTRHFDTIVLGRPDRTLNPSGVSPLSAAATLEARKSGIKRDQNNRVLLNSDHKSSGSPKGTTSPSRQTGDMLFDRILANSRNQVYDPVLGAFFPKDHPSVKASLTPGSLDERPLHSDFNYIKAMVKQRETMTKLLNKADSHHSIDMDGSTKAASYEHDGGKKGRKGGNKEGGNGELSENKAKVCCALCERPYHPHNLVGVVPFKAVAKWREQHQAGFSPSDRRLQINRMYEDSRLCIFCTQFFDDSFCDYIDYHRGKTSIDDRVLLLEGNREGSLLDPRITRILQQYSKIKKPVDVNRPLSRLNFKLTVMNLKYKGEVPLRLADVGSELARFSHLLEDSRARKDSAIHQLESLGLRYRNPKVVAKRLYDGGKSVMDKRQAGGEMYRTVYDFPDSLRGAAENEGGPPLLPFMPIMAKASLPVIPQHHKRKPLRLQEASQGSRKKLEDTLSDASNSPLPYVTDGNDFTQSQGPFLCDATTSPNSNVGTKVHFGSASSLTSSPLSSPVKTLSSSASFGSGRSWTIKRPSPSLYKETIDKAKKLYV